MALNLQEIVAISGKSGLFRVVSPARTGILVETLTEPRTRSVVPAQQQVSSLGDISMYVTTEENTVPLLDILQAIRARYGEQLPVTAKSEPQALVTFLNEVLPDYDRERVYLSDIKKLATWYAILGPLLTTAETAEVSETAETAEADTAGAATDVEAGAATDAEADAAPAGLSTGGEVPAQTPDAAEGKPVVQ